MGSGYLEYQIAASRLLQNKMPKISVVIPCYNTANYIARCLESLEHQIYKDFDVFLIDDCSSDNTIKVIEEYRCGSSMTIHLLKNDQNIGPSASRKRGIECSNAEFICFCDSDDWYDQDYLSEMSDAQTVDQANIVLTSFRLVLESGRKLDRLNVYLDSDLENRRRMMIKAPDSLCLMMIERRILVEVPHPDMRNGEDMALIPLLIMKSNKIASVNKCLYNYYCRGNSASMKPSMKMIESLEESFNFIEINVSSEFKLEKEFIGIRNLLYGALINLFKFSYNTRIANDLVDNFETIFPRWYQNISIKELPKSKRVFLCCVKYRLWLITKLLSQIHTILID